MLYEIITVFSSTDADGDLIAFSSDEEIVEALGAVQDGIFRVYVKLKGKLLILTK